jgi:hypothetical protein
VAGNGVLVAQKPLWRVLRTIRKEGTQVKRNTTLKLTAKDKAAAKAATLDSAQGLIRQDGSL